MTSRTPFHPRRRPKLPEYVSRVANTSASRDLIIISAGENFDIWIRQGLFCDLERQPGGDTTSSYSNKMIMIVMSAAVHD